MNKKEKRKIIEILSYPLAGIIYLLSMIPLRILYCFSKILFFLFFHFPGYRKQLVYNNLAKSFPGKDNNEILLIRKKFYKHLSNLIIEILKLLTISRKHLENRNIFTQEAKELINSFLSKDIPIIIVMGHYGNWEWSGTSFQSYFGLNPSAPYKPIKNKVFDNLMKKVRERAGVKVLPMKHFPKEMFSMRNSMNVAILIADQTPSKRHAYWVDFLNQDTPVFKGTARLSRMFNYPVIFCSSRPIKRGNYEIHAHLIASNPKDYDEKTLTKLHIQMLEKEIIRAPEFWLWTHRRWKHKRHVDVK